MFQKAPIVTPHQKKEQRQTYCETTYARSGVNHFDCYKALSKITHFEKMFQSELNLVPDQRILEKKIKVR